MASKRKQEASPTAQRAPVVRVAPAEQSPAFGSAVAVGRLLPGSTPAAPLVDFAGNVAGPVRARTTVPFDAAAVGRAVVTGQGVVLVFENGDRRLPIITGVIVEPSAAPFQELLASARPVPNSGRVGEAPAEARLDGRRVVLEGKKEVMLKCGEASITLRSDGRMVLRGAYIETYAKGINRIKGGSVKIN